MAWAQPILLPVTIPRKEGRKTVVLSSLLRQNNLVTPYFKEKKCPLCLGIENNFTFAPNFNPSNQHKMKKVVTMIAFAGACALVACGPSAKDKEAAQHKADSLKQDSINKAQAAAMAAQKAKADSAAKAAAKDSTKKDSTKK